MRRGRAPASISVFTFQVVVSTTATWLESGMETNSVSPEGEITQSEPGLFRNTMVSSLLLP